MSRSPTEKRPFAEPIVTTTDHEPPNPQHLPMPDHSAWSHYKPITIQDANVDANLTDFPLLVLLDGDTDIGNRCRADGHDVRFTLDDGVTELKYERLAWSGGDGAPVTARFWVQVPSLSSAVGASLRVYYGNPAAADGENVAGTFSASGLEAALHLNEADEPFADATGNGHSAEIVAGTQQEAGVIHMARGSTSEDSRLKILDNAAMEGQDEFAVDCWVTANGWTTYSATPMIWAQHDYTAAMGMRYYSPSNLLQYRVGAGQSGISHTPSVDTWYHILCVYERGVTRRLYVDGVAGPDVTPPDDPTVSGAYDWYLLGRRWSTSNFDGAMEEFRCWQTANPCGDAAAYAKFAHANVTAADNEVTIGEEVSKSKPPYRVVAGETFCTGASCAGAFCTGATEGSTFHAGIVAGEVDGRAN